MIYKKFIAFLLISFSFFQLFAIDSSAKELANEKIQIQQLKSSSDLYQFSQSLKQLSLPELQNVISSIQISAQEKSSSEILALKAAWLAAAQIARVNGYPLSATLVECAVYNSDYYETNGSFASAIKSTDAYRRMLRNLGDSDYFF